MGDACFSYFGQFPIYASLRYLWHYTSIAPSGLAEQCVTHSPSMHNADRPSRGNLGLAICEYYGIRVQTCAGYWKFVAGGLAYLLRKVNISHVVFLSQTYSNIILWNMVLLFLQSCRTDQNKYRSCFVIEKKKLNISALKKLKNTEFYSVHRNRATHYFHPYRMPPLSLLPASHWPLLATCPANKHKY